jgi:hypothetical protein
MNLNEFLQCQTWASPTHNPTFLPCHRCGYLLPSLLFNCNLRFLIRVNPHSRGRSARSVIFSLGEDKTKNILSCLYFVRKDHEIGRTEKAQEINASNLILTEKDEIRKSEETPIQCSKLGCLGLHLILNNTSIKINVMEIEQITLHHSLNLIDLPNQTESVNLV